MEQQYFRKEPVSLSAAVGSEVTLQCEVENQAGNVQWTKDGYALGEKVKNNIQKVYFNLFFFLLEFHDDSVLKEMINVGALTPAL